MFIDISSEYIKFKMEFLRYSQGFRTLSALKIIFTIPSWIIAIALDKKNNIIYLTLALIWCYFDLIVYGKISYTWVCVHIVTTSVIAALLFAVFANNIDKYFFDCGNDCYGSKGDAFEWYIWLEGAAFVGFFVSVAILVEIARIITEIFRSKYQEEPNADI